MAWVRLIRTLTIPFEFIWAVLTWLPLSIILFPIYWIVTGNSFAGKGLEDEECYMYHIMFWPSAKMFDWYDKKVGM